MRGSTAQAGSPSCCVFTRHRGHDLRGLCVGHRPQQPLTDERVRGADDSGRGGWARRGENFCSRIDVEPVDQSGEFGVVEVMNCRQGSAELHGMAPI